MLLALPMQEGRLDRLTDLKSIKDKNITVEEAMVLKQIQNAMKGDLRAFESIIALSESHNKTGEQPKAQETDNAFIEALNGKAAQHTRGTGSSFNTRLREQSGVIL